MTKTMSFDKTEVEGANVWFKSDGSMEIELLYHLRNTTTGERIARPSRRLAVELSTPFSPSVLPPGTTHADALKALINSLMGSVAAYEGI